MFLSDAKIWSVGGESTRIVKSLWSCDDISRVQDYFSWQPNTWLGSISGGALGWKRMCSYTIVHGLRDYDDYFQLKEDCIGLVEFSSIQICVAAIWCLAYGATYDIVDGYLRMYRWVYMHFCAAVVKVFGPTYLGKTKCSGHNSTHNTRCNERIFWDDWKCPLQAWEWKKLSIRLVSVIQRSCWMVQFHTWICAKWIWHSFQHDGIWQ